MKIQLIKKIPIKEFRNKPKDRIKREAREALLYEVAGLLAKKNIIAMKENERDTTFYLEMHVFTPSQWKEITNSLQAIKIAIEQKQDITPLMKNLCDELRRNIH